jgi:hypothetical protein
MEETYGRKWFKNKTHFSDFQHCTVGKIKFKKIIFVKITQTYM